MVWNIGPTKRWEEWRCCVVMRAGVFWLAVLLSALDTMALMETKFIASDGYTNDHYGYQVAIDGDTVVVGSCLADNGNGAESGSAYVYQRTGSSWVETELPDDAQVGEWYGFSAAIDGDTIAVGAPNGNAVYVYARSGSSWSLQQKLSVAGGALGSAVSIDGDTLAIGAYKDNNNRGAAYIYTRSGSTWTQQKKLTAPVASPNENVYFGCSIAIDGNTVIVGANQYTYSGKVYSGAAWVWTGSGSSWSVQGDLAALAGTDLQANDEYGYSVDIHGDTILVGSYRDDDYASETGSVYVFIRNGSAWSKQDKLTASNAGTGGKYFGSSVSVWGDRALIGADYDHIDDGREGCVHEFLRDGSTWTEQTPLITASDKASLDWFGCSVALAEEYAVVGSFCDDNENGSDAGAAYVYNLVSYPKVINEFQMNTYTNNRQQFPAIASNRQSNYIVVWESDGQDGDGYGIYGQRYSQNGIRIGNEFQVNTTTAGFQQSPDVAMNVSGNFVVVWRSPDAGGLYDIFARLFSSQGMPLTGEILVNTYTDSIQEEPSVAINDSGTFVVTWTSDREQPGHERSICGRVFHSGGAPATRELVISQTTNSNHSDVCIDENGDFAVVWNLSILSTTQTWSNRLRLYHSNGTAKGSAVDLNPSALHAASLPCIVSKVNGEWIAVWDQDPGNYENHSILCQHFHSDGSKLGEAYRIDDGSYSAHAPSVSLYEDGKMIVVWEIKDSLTGRDIRAREYSPDGVPLCDPFYLNTFTAGDQILPQVASIGNQYFAIWQSDGQDGSYIGIYGGLGPKTYRGDFDFDRRVGLSDLQMMAEGWLNGEPVLDIAPDGGDGIINLLDIALFAEQWF